MQHINQEFWDKAWETQRTDRYVDQRINKQILKLLKPVLLRSSKVLEIGCVPARRLSFLQREYGLDTYGLDYSLRGLLSSMETSNHLICCDLFHTPFRSEIFDLVYSLGVIEHFDDPRKVIHEHLALVREKGFVLIAVPNFNHHSVLSSLYMLGGRYEEVKKNHNTSIMTAENFRGLFINMPIEEIMCDYYGPPVLYSPPSTNLRRICAKINNTMDRVTIRSRILSPELVYVGQKFSQ